MNQPAWQPPISPDQSAGAAWHLIRLRRDGQPPLRFEGQLLARYDGRTSTAPIWHELTLYRVARGGYAVQITALHVAAVDTCPQVMACYAALLPTLEDAVLVFEQHDAARAATPGRAIPSVDFADPTISPTRLMWQATRLATLQKDIVQRYNNAVGALLVTLVSATQTHPKV